MPLEDYTNPSSLGKRESLEEGTLLIGICSVITRLLIYISSILVLIDITKLGVYVNTLLNMLFSK
jgi:hypothetical protein